MRNHVFVSFFAVLGVFASACSDAADDPPRAWEPEINSGPGGSCAKQTCASLGKTCGTHDDGCGGQLSCGKACVETACVPKTCQELAKTCGKHDDGCGGQADCGACSTCVADAKEGNDTPDKATNLGEFTDVPSVTRSVSNLTVGDGDEDWFTFAVADTGFDGNPIITATSSSASTEVSVFYMCKSASNDSTCSVAGEQPDTSVGKGCRANRTATVKTACGGTLTDSGTGFVRVRKVPGTAQCVSYGLTVLVR